MSGKLKERYLHWWLNRNDGFNILKLNEAKSIRKRTKKGFFKKIHAIRIHTFSRMAIWKVTNRFETSLTRYPSYLNHKYKWYVISLVSWMWNVSRLLQYSYETVSRENLSASILCVAGQTRRLRRWKCLVKIRSPVESLMVCFL